MEIGKLQPLTNIHLPLFCSTVEAGFPSPADDYIDKSLDLNEHLIKNPASTFYVRVRGDSMTGAGIFGGDLVMIDRSIDPTHGRIVLAVVNGEFTLKRFSKSSSGIMLMAENKNYAHIHITDHMEFQVWGVATNVIHSL